MPQSNSNASGWNLKHELGRRILQDMILKAKGNLPGIVLVVDPHTSRILSSCLRMHDLLSAGVLVLQNLFLQRERLNSLPAVYFITPSTESFALLVEDFPKPPPPVPHVSLGQRILAKLTCGGSAAEAGPEHHQPVVEKKPQYSCGHLFFSSPVPPAQMKQLQSSAIDMHRIKSFVEFGCDFVAFESRVFHFDQPHWIPRLYFGSAAEDGPTNAVLLPIAKQLMSLLSTTLAKGEMPYVRFVSDELNIGKTFISRQFADLIDKELTKQLKAATQVPTTPAPTAASSTTTSSSAPTPAPAPSTAASPSPVAPPPPPPRNTTLLIIDRSLDPLTPLMHEFTFQAMVNDLMKVSMGEIAYLTPTAKRDEPEVSPAATMTNDAKALLQKQLQEKREADAKAAAEADKPASPNEEEDGGEVVLSEDDALWLEYRHKHIADVMIDVNRKLKDFTSSNKMAQYQHLLGKTGPTSKDSVKDVLKAVGEIPEYKLAMKRFTKHVHLAEECLNKFKLRNLQTVAELEQDIATGTTIEGKIMKDFKKLNDRFKDAIGDRNNKVLTVLDKLRLCAIYAIVQGGISEPMMKILTTYLHPRLLKCIVGQNLSDLGVEIDTFEPQLSKERILELLERNSKQTLALMRYTPTLQSILEGFVTNTLSVQQFPYTKSGGRPAADEEEQPKPQPSTDKNKKGDKKDKKTDKEREAEEAAKIRQKILDDAAKDKAHKPLGRSARRKTSEKDGVGTTPIQPHTSHTSLQTAPSHSASMMDDEDEDEAKSSAPSFVAPVAPVVHRYIVFMLGGLCFSEMRACYSVCQSEHAELIIGSTAPLTPNEFLLDLSNLTREEFQARVAANTASAIQPPTIATVTPAASVISSPDDVLLEEKTDKPHGDKKVNNNNDHPVPPRKRKTGRRDAMDSSSESDISLPDSSDDEQPLPPPKPRNGKSAPAKPTSDAPAPSAPKKSPATATASSTSSSTSASTANGHAPPTASSKTSSMPASTAAASTQQPSNRRARVRQPELHFESEEDEEDDPPPKPTKSKSSSNAPTASSTTSKSQTKSTQPPPKQETNNATTARRR